MFLPRKLQKRCNAGRTTVPTAKETIAAGHNDKDVKALESPQEEQRTNPLNRNDSISRDDTLVGAASSPPLIRCRTNVETAKLDRLVDFLYLRLSPLALSLAQTKLTSDGRNASEYFSYSPQDNAQQQHPDKELNTSSHQSFKEHKPATIHLARLLTLIPGLNKRCKSIAFLSEALKALAASAAANWFVVHEDAFLLKWLPPYLQFKDLVSTSRNPSLISLQLAPLLVYAESIPPRIRSRAQAAAYLHHLMSSHPAGPSGFSGIVVGVFEPSMVDRKLMSCHNENLSATILEGKWTSGRAFFLLNSSDHVGSLCSKYPWHFSDRAANREKHDETKLIGDPTEPIRCLSWGGWAEMREQYCKQLELIRQKARTTSSGQYKPKSGPVSPGIHVVQDKRKRKSTGDPPGDTQQEVRSSQREKWYRGTVLLLSLPPTPMTGDALIVPPFKEASKVTPDFLNRHLKPQLEQRVPESISYIHPQPLTDQTANTDTVTIQVAIRTAHRHLANQLLTHFSELESMDETAEDQYWSEMPDKPRTTALNRLRRISAKLNTAAT